MEKDIQTAKNLLKGINLSMTEVARLFLELIETSRATRLKSTEKIKSHCRHVISLGVKAKEMEEKTVPFKEAYEECLRAKAHRSAYTLRDIRYIGERLMRETPGLAERPTRAIGVEECREMLERVFTHAPQRKKARAILSGIFSIAKKRLWCEKNPIEFIDIPIVKEKEIIPLTYEESMKLLETASQPKFRACKPAIALMMYAGIRPEEIKRLRWKNLDLEEREIIISPTHSKTGGGRHITIYPPLYQLLKKEFPRNAEESICPKQWSQLWPQIRKKAGFHHWQKDVLRHTFASFHVKNFHNLPLLQSLMGHRDSHLLRSRYVNLYGLSRKDAKKFWQLSQSMLTNK